MDFIVYGLPQPNSSPPNIFLLHFHSLTSLCFALHSINQHQRIYPLKPDTVQDYAVQVQKAYKQLLSQALHSHTLYTNSRTNSTSPRWHKTAFPPLPFSHFQDPLFSHKDRSSKHTDRLQELNYNLMSSF
ncbi:hypothetical protein Hanom_Chr07g00631781 [Helianthus anomalus]